MEFDADLELGDDPYDNFSIWFERAKEAVVEPAEAVSLATASVQGQPSVRIVLFKGILAGGFTFYTNYDSRKGHDIAENPVAAMLFFWPSLARQIRLEGKIERLSADESAVYFSKRERGSQIGAWASHQSRVLASRQLLMQNVKQLEEAYRGQEVPCPAAWGGYRLLPNSLEFWQGRANRLHDRFLFTRLGNEWRVERLAP